MKKIIRLTESDLTRIVRRVIREQGPFAPGMGPSTKSTTPPGVNPTYKPNLKTTKTKNEKWWDSMAELLKSEGFESTGVYEDSDGYIETYGHRFANGRDMEVTFYSNATPDGIHPVGKRDEVVIYEPKLAFPCASPFEGKHKDYDNCKKKFDSFTSTLGAGCYRRFDYAQGMIKTNAGVALKVWCKDSMKKIINYVDNLPKEEGPKE